MYGSVYLWRLKKNKIHSFTLFQKGHSILHPDPYNHTRHKENPQPRPITTRIPGKVNQVVTVLNCTCINWDVLHLQATPFRGDILEKTLKQTKAKISILSSTKPQELCPFLSPNVSFFPTSSSFSWPHNPVPSFPVLFSHHPLPHLQCHLCQLSLQFFGFFKRHLQAFFLTASWMQNMSLN